MERFPKKITVVTPSYNQGEFLEETLDSVLSQNYPRLEYIVIDGGSTDGSKRILQKYAPHLSYWVSEPDGGQSHALNKGFARATGELMTWICSDDLLKPEALKQAANYFEEDVEQQFGVIHGGCTMLEGSVETSTNFGHFQQLPESYFTYMAFPQPASFFRKSVFERAGRIDESLHYAMDYDLFLRMKLISDFRPVSDVFAAYRLHEASKTVSHQDKFLEEYRQVFSRWIRTFDLREVRQFFIDLEEYRGGAQDYKALLEEPLPADFLTRVVVFWLEHQMSLSFGRQEFGRVKRMGEVRRAYAGNFQDTAIQKLWESANYEEASWLERLEIRWKRLFA